MKTNPVHGCVAEVQVKLECNCRINSLSERKSRGVLCSSAVQSCHLCTLHKVQRCCGFDLGVTGAREELTNICFVCFCQIHETIESINQLKIQRDFMLSFSKDPKGYIQDLLRSQSRDLKVSSEVIVCPGFGWGS